MGLALKIREPLKKEAEKGRVKVGKQTGRGHRKDSPKTDGPLGESAEQAAKQIQAVLPRWVRIEDAIFTGGKRTSVQIGHGDRFTGVVIH